MTAAARGQAHTGQPALRLVRLNEPPPLITADSEAMREVWELHGSVLMHFALRLTLGDKQRAEDIVQETLVRAWRHPEVVGSGRPIRSWLLTVTRRVAIDMWRARSRTDEILEDERIDMPDPTEPIDQAITAMDVRAALSKLDPAHRQVIVEMYWRDRSVAEIAERLQIPEGTVKSRAYYGLRHLRKALSAASGNVRPTPVAPVAPARRTVEAPVAPARRTVEAPVAPARRTATALPPVPGPPGTEEPAQPMSHQNGPQADASCDPSRAA